MSLVKTQVDSNSPMLTKWTPVNQPVEGRTFFAYTKYDTFYDWEKRKEFPKDRGCVVVSKVGGVLKYGVSICTVGDSWNKIEGRKLAEERMHLNFGVIKLDNEHIQRAFIALGEQRAVINLLNNIKDSVGMHTTKYKRRIEKFNKALKGKLVETAVADAKIEFSGQ